MHKGDPHSIILFDLLHRRDIKISRLQHEIAAGIVLNLLGAQTSGEELSRLIPYLCKKVHQTAPD